jgi:hypothetical protein
MGEVDQNYSTITRELTRSSLPVDMNRLGVEIINSLYKEEDIIKKYKYILTELLTNLYLFGLICKYLRPFNQRVCRQTVKFIYFCSVSNTGSSNGVNTLSSMIGIQGNKQDLRQAEKQSKRKGFSNSYQSPSAKNICGKLKREALGIVAHEFT